MKLKWNIYWIFWENTQKILFSKVFIWSTMHRYVVFKTCDYGINTPGVLYKIFW